MGNDLFVGRIERMLQVLQSGDNKRPQDWAARPRLKWLGSDPVNFCPVNHVSQFDEQMVQVNMLRQRITFGIAALKIRRFLRMRTSAKFATGKTIYVGHTCKLNTDLSQLKAHGRCAFAVFQGRLNIFAGVLARSTSGSWCIGFCN
jgi:hypothetical protein